MSENNPHVVTQAQYEELYKEVLLFAKIGGITAAVDNIWKMCTEEFTNELVPAVKNSNAIEVVDGVADSFVVFTQLHHYYMSKPTWEQVVPFDDMNDVKPLHIHLSEKDTTIVPHLMEVWKDFSADFAKWLNFNLYKAVKAVNISNLSKFPSLDQLKRKYSNPAILTAILLDKSAKDCEEASQGLYNDVVANLSSVISPEGTPYVVYRSNGGQGKIVKNNLFYQKPNFDDCWIKDFNKVEGTSNV